jgi:hypothetical protein
LAHRFTKTAFSVGPHGGTPAVEVTGFDKGGNDAAASGSAAAWFCEPSLRGNATMCEPAPISVAIKVQGGIWRWRWQSTPPSAIPLLQHRVGRLMRDMVCALQAEQAGSVVTRTRNKRGGRWIGTGAPVWWSGMHPRSASVSKPGSEKPGIQVSRSEQSGDVCVPNQINKCGLIVGY